MAKEKGNLLHIKGLNKGEKLRQLTFCCMKFLKDGYLGNDVEGICESTYSTIQLGWTPKITQTP